MTSVLTEDIGAVRIIRLNRPTAMNALDPDTIAQLGRHLRSADDDAGVRAIVLTGTGDRAFCAGMDLKAFALDPGAFAEPDPEFARFVEGGLSTPVVGAANGTAVGGGFELLLACDLILLADHVRLGLPEVKRGLFAALGGTRLSTRLPLPLAMEIALTGDLIDASRAEQIGLANRVVPAAELVQASVTLASSIAANGPLAVAATKRLLLHAQDVDRSSSWEHIRRTWPEVAGSADATEGARAFAERRSAAFTGT